MLLSSSLADERLAKDKTRLKAPKDLHQEGIRLERIIMHLNPGDVADDLQDFAADHDAQE